MIVGEELEGKGQAESLDRNGVRGEVEKAKMTPANVKPKVKSRCKDDLGELDALHASRRKQEK
jgi:hypothetical protein